MTRRKSRDGEGRQRKDRTEKGTKRYALRLYVTGATARSLRAIANVTAICEQYLKGSYDLEVLDIYRHPEKLREDQIVAVPALVKRLPLPLRLLVGDFSKPQLVLQGLGIFTQA